MKLTLDGIVHKFEILENGWNNYANDHTENGPLSETARNLTRGCAEQLGEVIAEVRETAAEQAAATQFTRNRAAELAAEYRRYTEMPDNERVLAVLRGDFSTDAWSARAYTILEELTRDA